MKLRTIPVYCLLLSTWAVPALGGDRNYDAAELAAGNRLYQDNCAVCHGAEGQGTPDWQQRGADGKLPPPPLNGTAHTWHHPAIVLFRTVREGTASLGGNMPAWRDKLSDDEILLIINWITSLWPDEIYEAWKRRN